MRFLLPCAKDRLSRLEIQIKQNERDEQIQQDPKESSRKDKKRNEITSIHSNVILEHPE